MRSNIDPEEGDLGGRVTGRKVVIAQLKDRMQ